MQQLNNGQKGIKYAITLILKEKIDFNLFKINTTWHTNMDPISQISQIIRTNLKRNKEQRPLKTSSPTNKTSKSENKAGSLQKEIALRINELPNKDRTGPMAIEILVSSILENELGSQVLSDPLLKKSTQKIVDSIISDKESQKNIRHMLKELHDTYMK